MYQQQSSGDRRERVQWSGTSVSRLPSWPLIAPAAASPACVLFDFTLINSDDMAREGHRRGQEADELAALSRALREAAAAAATSAQGAIRSNADVQKVSRLAAARIVFVSRSALRAPLARPINSLPAAQYAAEMALQAVATPAVAAAAAAAEPHGERKAPKEKKQKKRGKEEEKKERNEKKKKRKQPGSEDEQTATGGAPAPLATAAAPPAAACSGVPPTAEALFPR